MLGNYFKVTIVREILPMSCCYCIDTIIRLLHYYLLLVTRGAMSWFELALVLGGQKGQHVKCLQNDKIIFLSPLDVFELDWFIYHQNTLNCSNF